MNLRSAPLVSICIPTFNNEATIERCVRSALEQRLTEFECLVVDDCSSDGTLARLRAVSDSRIRIVRNPKNVGLAANHTACVREARGGLIKFLHADDTLTADCLTALSEPFSNPGVGLVFSPRRLVIEPADDPGLAEWATQYSRLELPLRPTARPIGGREIVLRYIESGLRGNWLGEPSCIMVRREAFVRAGGFNREIHQLVDMDMWLRILLHADAQWVDRPVSTRTMNAATATARNFAAKRGLFDRLWLIDGISHDPAPGQVKHLLRRLQRDELVRVLRYVARHPAGEAYRGLARYAAGRLGLRDPRDNVT
jgi:glycosyltransferase involved in cell wall biosynthesis